jgi:hypothetical protein
MQAEIDDEPPTTPTSCTTFTWWHTASCFSLLAGYLASRDPPSSRSREMDFSVCPPPPPPSCSCSCPCHAEENCRRKLCRTTHCHPSPRPAPHDSKAALANEFSDRQLLLLHYFDALRPGGQGGCGMETPGVLVLMMMTIMLTIFYSDEASKHASKKCGMLVPMLGLLALF